MHTTHQEEKAGPLYHRDSWYAGGSWESYESGVVPGTMRCVNGLIVRAWTVTRRGWFRADRVHWISVDPSALRKVGINEREGA